MLTVNGKIVISHAVNSSIGIVNDGICRTLSQNEDNTDFIGIGEAVEDDFNTVTEDLGSGDISATIDAETLVNGISGSAFTVESQIKVSVFCGKDIGCTIVLNFGIILSIDFTAGLGIGFSGKGQNSGIGHGGRAVESCKSIDGNFAVDGGVVVQDQFAVRTIESCHSVSICNSTSFIHGGTAAAGDIAVDGEFSAATHDSADIKSGGFGS